MELIIGHDISISYQTDKGAAVSIFLLSYYTILIVLAATIFLKKEADVVYKTTDNIINFTFLKYHVIKL